jgi:hypothetical protein
LGKLERIGITAAGLFLALGLLFNTLDTAGAILRALAAIALFWGALHLFTAKGSSPK